MTSRIEIQNKIQQLEKELQYSKEQLNNYNKISIDIASVGDFLGDGSVLIQKFNGIALIAAPKYTEVESTWSREFTEVFDKLKQQGFNQSQWFIPTKEQLELAVKNISDKFPISSYWSSTEYSEDTGVVVHFNHGFTPCVHLRFKDNAYSVRAFRCVTYTVV